MISKMEVFFLVVVFKSEAKLGEHRGALLRCAGAHQHSGGRTPGEGAHTRGGMREHRLRRRPEEEGPPKRRTRGGERRVGPAGGAPGGG